MTFSELRKANVKRCEEVFHPIDSWSPADWAVALAGEVGEACNAVKKLRRFDDGTNTEKDPSTIKECIQLIANELADTIIYTDLLATRLGIDLENSVRQKFNIVSKRMNSSVYLDGEIPYD